ncbi:MAG: carbon-nitrogen hydrolase family protein [Planctomycetota bacterium]
MKVGIAQMAPVFLDRRATLAKVEVWIADAGALGCELLAFGEALVPAYPVWLDRTDGARFESDYQKQMHARYLEQGVAIPAADPRISSGTPQSGTVGSEPGTPGGDLAGVCEAAAAHGVAVVLGVAERALDRGGHSLFCSRVFIGGRGDDAGRVLSVHRKLMPTYEERLCWAPGDGAGLVTHRVGAFTAGALNCWENWMPTARAALYAQGEDLHVMLWPGAARLTRDLTRFVAREGRSFVVSAGALIREQDLPADLPDREGIASPGEVLYDGGSCIAGPDGKWVVEPVVGEERLITAEFDHATVLAERQNFDPAGHYARPDILSLTLDRRRHVALQTRND